MKEPTDIEIARFWKKVSYSEEGCWEWRGARASYGHGLAYIGKHQERAQRVAWWMFYGPFDESLKVCHHCDNPPCCRPDHLFLGTQVENLADMTAKGRRSRGERHQWHGQNQSGEANNYAKLTAESVADIRAMGLAGYQAPEIAEQFGVHLGTIGYVLRGETWKGIEPSAPLPPVERRSYDAKLGPEIAQTIREQYTGRRGELTRLSERYGVSRPTVRAILDGRSYRER